MSLTSVVNGTGMTATLWPLMLATFTSWVQCSWRNSAKSARTFTSWWEQLRKCKHFVEMYLSYIIPAVSLSSEKESLLRSRVETVESLNQVSMTRMEAMEDILKVKVLGTRSAGLMWFDLFVRAVYLQACCPLSSLLGTSGETSQRLYSSFIGVVWFYLMRFCDLMQKLALLRSLIHKPKDNLISEFTVCDQKCKLVRSDWSKQAATKGWTHPPSRKYKAQRQKIAGGLANAWDTNASKIEYDYGKCDSVNQ